jgi:hypothetical protein
LHLHAACAEGVATPQEALATLTRLDDKIFWLSGAQVEIMRLLTGRWPEFSDEERGALEQRIRRGVPRDLFAADAFEDEEEWTSIWDSEVMKRLTRIAVAGGSLSQESLSLLDEIRARHPKWVPSPGDRDDFKMWYENHSGPQGDLQLLANVADGALVAEAMRLQREEQFEQGDVWRMVCSADPQRALRGLEIEVQAGRWEAEAWRCLFWTAGEKSDFAFQLNLGTLLMTMPDAILRELLPSATSWFQRRRELLTSNPSGGGLFFQLWDKLADLVFITGDTDDSGRAGDLSTRALNEPGGILAWVLLEHIAAGNPKAGDCLGLEHSRRLSRAVGASGQPGLLARVLLARSLAYLDAVDPEWTSANMLPHLSVDDPDGVALWHARSADNIGSARLFNRLKPAMLVAFEGEMLSDHDLEGLMAQLLTVAIGRRRQEAHEYELASAEVKRALSASSPSVRRNASWQFWRLMGEQDGDPLDKVVRWREVIGPLFREVWPLDARFRDDGTSHNLILMALECNDAFDDAVDVIIDFVVPHQQYQLSHLLRLEREHDELLRRYPKSFLRLANALIDPVVHPVPSDLSEFLQACVEADGSVVNESSYIRLYGLRRQYAA